MHRLKQYIKGDGLGALLIKASIGSAGLRVTSMLLSFLVGVLLARNLGPSGYGIYALVMAIIALLTVPTEFGLPSLVTREVAVARAEKNWGRIRGVLSWANTVVAILSLSLLGITAGWFIFGGYIEDKLFSKTFLWGLLLIPLVALSNLRGATLRGLEQIVRGQLPELMLRPGVFVLLLGSTIWFTKISLTADRAMALHVMATAVAFLVGVAMLFKAIPSQCRHAAPVTEPGKWVNSAFPMALTEGMRHLQGHFAVLLLGWFATQTDVGLYRVAAQIGILVAFPVSILNIVVAPFISRLHAEKDHFRLKKVVSYSATVMFLGALCIFIVFALFGQYLLGLFFGAEFKPAYNTLLILCGGQLASSFFGPNATLLNMTHHERLVTRAFLISLIFSISLGIGLVPDYGIIGAAVASTVGLLTWNILMWNYARLVLSINTSVIASSAHL